MRTRDRYLAGRRTFLRAAGGLAIPLPLSAAWSRGKARANTAVPTRLFTLFFGNGLPAALADAGYTGALAPLAPFADRLTMVRNIESRADGLGNGHDRGCAGFACAMDTPSRDSKGGPSLDWVAYEQTRPNTPRAVLSAGVFSTRKLANRPRYVHSWRGPGRPNDPFTDPLALFHFVFGGQALLDAHTPEAVAARNKARLRASVLDAVLEEYRALTSPAGPLPASARQSLDGHMEHVRDLEKQALTASAPPTSDIPAGCVMAKPASMPSGTPGTFPQWETIWPVMADLVVLALRCDLVRFGSLVLTSGGDEYGYNGPGVAAASAHADLYHRWPERAQEVTTMVAWKMARVAELLQRLDAESTRDAEGRTLLEGTALLIGTELDNPATHTRTDMTFLLAGRRDVWRSGIVRMGARSDVDLYRAVLGSLGVVGAFGDGRYAGSGVAL